MSDAATRSRRRGDVRFFCNVQGCERRVAAANGLANKGQQAVQNGLAKLENEVKLAPVLNRVLNCRRCLNGEGLCSRERTGIGKIAANQKGRIPYLKMVQSFVNTSWIISGDGLTAAEAGGPSWI